MPPNRLKFGWNQRQVAKLAGVHYGTYWRYENLTLSPLTLDGEWKESARSVALVLGLYPEDLWPDHTPSVNVRTLEDASVVLASQLGGNCQAFPPNSQDTLLFEKQAISEVLRAEGRLGKRNRAILYRRIVLDHTLRDVATDFGVTTERISQVCEVSIRKIRSELKRTEIGKELLRLGPNVLTV